MFTAEVERLTSLVWHITRDTQVTVTDLPTDPKSDADICKKVMRQPQPRHKFTVQTRKLLSQL